MLSVKLHTGLLAQRSPNNTLAQLDIAYKVQKAWADYSLQFALKGVGEVAPAELLSYPRWAGSVWDLVARALALVLFRNEAFEPAPAPDKRCAYATKLCAVVERTTAKDNHVELASVEILQDAKKRGHYTATFREDILGERKATFVYGLKSLQHSELLLRAICYAYFGKDTLGERPALILPTTLQVDGKNVFDTHGLPEPAKTGFNRYRSHLQSSMAALLPMASADEYAAFLTKG
jgi:hypothetical protein